MLVNLLVPGSANLQRLARCLNDLGVLNLFAYSHALRTTPESLGLPDDRAINLWVKEYLVRGHLMAVGWHYSDLMFPVYLGFWERGVLQNWRPAPVVHVLLWGGARRILARANKEGSATLGLIANSHPEFLTRLLAEEADRVGVKQRRSLQRLDRAILDEVALCRHLHAESEFTRNSYAAHGFPHERIHVVRPGKDFSAFYPATGEERNAADDAFRVICVGAVSLRKGQVHLLEAWRRLSLTNAELTLIGAMTDQIAPVIRRYSGLFTYINRAPELRSHFVRSSIMVVPSIEDGYAHVVGEALACGIPVITTKNTGAADYIRDGVNGYVVSAASPEAIAEKLLLVYRHRALLRSLQEGARATIPVVGSWQDCARKFVELYRRIAPADFPLVNGTLSAGGSLAMPTSDSGRVLS